MALTKTTIYPDSWTKIGDNVTTITFQNQSDTPILIELTAADTAPALNTPGLVYDRFEGELKKSLADMTYVSSPAYVWARSMTASASITHEST